MKGASSATVTDSGASAWIGSYGPGLAVDGDLSEESRWACREDLESLNGDPCEIWFTLGQPTDIEYMQVALWEGDQTTRTIRITFEDSSGSTTTATFPSSGTTESFENFYVFTDNTVKVTMRAVSLDDDETLGIIEVKVFAG